MILSALLIFWRCFSISKQELLINEEIRVKEVRLVGPDGSPLGIVSSADALDQAYAKNLDLVLIAPKAEPPVCKIMDYGKYKFELAKRDKEAKKNQKVMTIKEIRLSMQSILWVPRGAARQGLLRRGVKPSLNSRMKSAAMVIWPLLKRHLVCFFLMLSPFFLMSGRTPQKSGVRLEKTVMIIPKRWASII